MGIVGQIVGGFLILAGCTSLIYAAILFFQRWRKKGHTCAIGELFLAIISIVLEISSFLVCIGIIILGFSLVLYS